MTSVEPMSIRKIGPKENKVFQKNISSSSLKWLSSSNSTTSVESMSIRKIGENKVIQKNVSPLKWLSSFNSIFIRLLLRDLSTISRNVSKTWKYLASTLYFIHVKKENRPKRNKIFQKIYLD